MRKNSVGKLTGANPKSHSRASYKDDCCRTQSSEEDGYDCDDAMISRLDKLESEQFRIRHEFAPYSCQYDTSTKLGYT